MSAAHHRPHAPREPSRVALLTSTVRGHNHVAEFNEGGDGHTSEGGADGHRHKVTSCEVQPAADGHTHELTDHRASTEDGGSEVHRRAPPPPVRP
jgi:hypothetical protein